MCISLSLTWIVSHYYVRERECWVCIYGISEVFYNYSLMKPIWPLSPSLLGTINIVCTWYENILSQQFELINVKLSCSLASLSWCCKVLTISEVRTWPSPLAKFVLTSVSFHFYLIYLTFKISNVKWKWFFFFFSGLICTCFKFKIYPFIFYKGNYIANSNMYPLT